MNNKEIYEVTREEYKDMLETIKPSSRDIHQYDNNDSKVFEIYSKTTGELLISRECFKNENKPEKYYIWNLPSKEDSLPPRPKYRLVLETPEEVQEYLNAVKRFKETHNA